MFLFRGEVHVDGAEEVLYLDLNVAHFSCGPDDGPAHQRREDVLWEVGACIATLHKLKDEREREQVGEDKEKDNVINRGSRGNRSRSGKARHKPAST